MCSQNQRVYIKLIAGVLASTFTLQQFAFASPSPVIKWNRGEHSVSASEVKLSQTNLSLPESVALISEVFEAEAQDAKTIILVQDAHTNESGQINLAKALDLILEREDLRHVFTEGGIGDDSLLFIKEYGDAQTRERVGLSYLRKGLIKGTEYLNFTSSRDFVLWGVEDRNLYAQSLEIYRNVVETRGDHQNLLKQIGQSIDTLKPKLLSPDLLAYVESQAAFERDEISVTDYLEELYKWANKKGVLTASFIHLSQLRTIKNMEDNIDFEKAAKENESQVSGYPVSSKYPHLNRYLSYLKESSKIDPKGVLEDLELFEKRIEKSLIKTKDEKRLVDISNIRNLMKRLLDLSLDPQGFQNLAEYLKHHDLGSLVGFLNRKIMDLNAHYERVLLLKEDSGDMIQKAKAFYDLTFQRDVVFVERIMEKMKETKEQKAILVTGGFHTENLKQLLKKRNLSYVVVAPQVLHPTNHKRYERLLLAQNIKTDTIAVMDAAVDKPDILVDLTLSVASSKSPDLAKVIQRKVVSVLLKKDLRRNAYEQRLLGVDSTVGGARSTQKSRKKQKSPSDIPSTLHDRFVYLIERVLEYGEPETMRLLNEEFGFFSSGIAVGTNYKGYAGFTFEGMRNALFWTYPKAGKSKVKKGVYLRVPGYANKSVRIKVNIETSGKGKSALHVYAYDPNTRKLLRNVFLNPLKAGLVNLNSRSHFKLRAMGVKGVPQFSGAVPMRRRVGKDGFEGFYAFTQKGKAVYLTGSKSRKYHGIYKDPRLETVYGRILPNGQDKQEFMYAFMKKDDWQKRDAIGEWPLWDEDNGFENEFLLVPGSGPWFYACLQGNHEAVRSHAMLTSRDSTGGYHIFRSDADEVNLTFWIRRNLHRKGNKKPKQIQIANNPHDPLLLLAYDPNHASRGDSTVLVGANRDAFDLSSKTPIEAAYFNPKSGLLEQAWKESTRRYRRLMTQPKSEAITPVLTRMSAADDTSTHILNDLQGHKVNIFSTKHRDSLLWIRFGRLEDIPRSPRGVEVIALSDDFRPQAVLRRGYAKKGAGFTWLEPKTAQGLTTSKRAEVDNELSRYGYLPYKNDFWAESGEPPVPLSHRLFDNSRQSLAIVSESLNQSNDASNSQTPQKIVYVMRNADRLTAEGKPEGEIYNEMLAHWIAQHGGVSLLDDLHDQLIHDPDTRDLIPGMRERVKQESGARSVHLHKRLHIPLRTSGKSGIKEMVYEDLDGIRSAFEKRGIPASTYEAEISQWSKGRVESIRMIQQVKIVFWSGFNRPLPLWAVQIQGSDPALYLYDVSNQDLVLVNQLKFRDDRELEDFYIHPSGKLLVLSRDEQDYRLRIFDEKGNPLWFQHPQGESRDHIPVLNHESYGRLIEVHPQSIDVLVKEDRNWEWQDATHWTSYRLADGKTLGREDRERIEDRRRTWDPLVLIPINFIPHVGPYLFFVAYHSWNAWLGPVVTLDPEGLPFKIVCHRFVRQKEQQHDEIRLVVQKASWASGEQIFPRNFNNVSFTRRLPELLPPKELKRVLEEVSNNLGGHLILNMNHFVSEGDDGTAIDTVALKTVLEKFPMESRFLTGSRSGPNVLAQTLIDSVSRVGAIRGGMLHRSLLLNSQLARILRSDMTPTEMLETISVERERLRTFLEGSGYGGVLTSLNMVLKEWDKKSDNLSSPKSGTRFSFEHQGLDRFFSSIRFVNITNLLGIATGMVGGAWGSFELFTFFEWSVIVNIPLALVTGIFTMKLAEIFLFLINVLYWINREVMIQVTFEEGPIEDTRFELARLKWIFDRQKGRSWIYGFADALSQARERFFGLDSDAASQDHLDFLDLTELLLAEYDGQMYPAALKNLLAALQFSDEKYGQGLAEMRSRAIKMAMGAAETFNNSHLEVMAKIMNRVKSIIDQEKTGYQDRIIIRQGEKALQIYQVRLNDIPDNPRVASGAKTVNRSARTGSRLKRMLKGQSKFPEEMLRKWAWEYIQLAKDQQTPWQTKDPNRALITNSLLRTAFDQHVLKVRNEEFGVTGLAQWLHEEPRWKEDENYLAVFRLMRQSLENRGTLSKQTGLELIRAMKASNLMYPESAFLLGDYPYGIEGKKIKLITGPSTPPPTNGTASMAKAAMAYETSNPNFFEGKVIWEWGAGHGLLSIMLALLYDPKSVSALDVNADLTDIFAINRMLNDVEPELLKFIVSNHFDALPDGAKADVIFINPNQRVEREEAPFESASVKRGRDQFTVSDHFDGLHQVRIELSEARSRLSEEGVIFLQLLDRIENFDEIIVPMLDILGYGYHEIPESAVYEDIRGNFPAQHVLFAERRMAEERMGRLSRLLSPKPMRGIWREFFSDIPPPVLYKFFKQGKKSGQMIPLSTLQAKRVVDGKKPAFRKFRTIVLYKKEPAMVMATGSRNRFEGAGHDAKHVLRQIQSKNQQDFSRVDYNQVNQIASGIVMALSYDDIYRERMQRLDADENDVLGMDARNLAKVTGWLVEKGGEDAGMFLQCLEIAQKVHDVEGHNKKIRSERKKAYERGLELLRIAVRFGADDPVLLNEMATTLFHLSSLEGTPKARRERLKEAEEITSRIMTGEDIPKGAVVTLGYEKLTFARQIAKEIRDAIRERLFDEALLLMDTFEHAIEEGRGSLLNIVRPYQQNKAGGTGQVRRAFQGLSALERLQSEIYRYALWAPGLRVQIKRQKNYEFRALVHAVRAFGHAIDAMNFDASVEKSQGLYRDALGAVRKACRILLNAPFRLENASGIPRVLSHLKGHFSKEDFAWEEKTEHRDAVSLMMELWGLSDFDEKVLMLFIEGLRQESTEWHESVDSFLDKVSSFVLRGIEKKKRRVRAIVQAHTGALGWDRLDLAVARAFLHHNKRDAKSLKNFLEGSFDNVTEDQISRRFKDGRYQLLGMKLEDKPEAQEPDKVSEPDYTKYSKRDVKESIASDANRLTIISDLFHRLVPWASTDEQVILKAYHEKYKSGVAIFTKQGNELLSDQKDWNLASLRSARIGANGLGGYESSRRLLERRLGLLKDEVEKRIREERTKVKANLAKVKSIQAAYGLVSLEPIEMELDEIVHQLDTLVMENGELYLSFSYFESCLIQARRAYSPVADIQARRSQLNEVNALLNEADKKVKSLAALTSKDLSDVAAEIVDNHRVIFKNAVMDEGFEEKKSEMMRKIQLVINRLDHLMDLGERSTYLRKRFSDLAIQLQQTRGILPSIDDEVGRDLEKVLGEIKTLVATDVTFNISEAYEAALDLAEISIPQHLSQAELKIKTMRQEKLNQIAGQVDLLIGVLRHTRSWFESSVAPDLFVRKDRIQEIQEGFQMLEQNLSSFCAKLKLGGYDDESQRLAFSINIAKTFGTLANHFMELIQQDTDSMRAALFAIGLDLLEKANTRELRKIVMTGSSPYRGAEEITISFPLNEYGYPVGWVARLGDKDAKPMSKASQAISRDKAFYTVRDHFNRWKDYKGRGPLPFMDMMDVMTKTMAFYGHMHDDNGGMPIVDVHAVMEGAFHKGFDEGQVLFQEKLAQRDDYADLENSEISLAVGFLKPEDRQREWERISAFTREAIPGFTIQEWPEEVVNAVHQSFYPSGTRSVGQRVPQPGEIEILKNISQRNLATFTDMIKRANQKSQGKEKPRSAVGGQPAAAASCLQIFMLLELFIKRAQDHVAYKPHGAPVLHGLRYLEGEIDEDVLENYRNTPFDPLGNLHAILGQIENEKVRESVERQMVGLLESMPKGATEVIKRGLQSYPGTHEATIPTGSMGIPPVAVITLGIAYKWLQEHKEELGIEVPDSRFIAVLGDAELDEGVLREALEEAARYRVANVTHIVDYNHQSLDGNRDDTDYQRIIDMYKATGWKVLERRWGRVIEKAFLDPTGGEDFEETMNALGHTEYQMLLGTDGEAVRDYLLEKARPDAAGRLEAFLSQYDNERLFRLFQDVAGHDFEVLAEVMNEALLDEDQPVAIVVRTIKGKGLDPLVGDPLNHKKVPKEDFMKVLRQRSGTTEEEPYQRFDADSKEARLLAEVKERRLHEQEAYEALIARNREKTKRHPRSKRWPHVIHSPMLPSFRPPHEKKPPNPFRNISTHIVFNNMFTNLMALLDKDASALSKSDQTLQAVAMRMVGGSPDVGSSTVAGILQSVFGYTDVSIQRIVQRIDKDRKRVGKLPLEPFLPTPKGRHFRLGIKEMFSIMMAAGLGQMNRFTGVSLVPIFSVYDMFTMRRALDMLFYLQYWGSHAIIVGTPSGSVLSTEGAQHQSSLSGPIAKDLPNTIILEPWSPYTASWIFVDALRLMETGLDQGRNSVYLRHSTLLLEDAEEIWKRLAKQKRFEKVLRGGDINDTHFIAQKVGRQIRREVLNGGGYRLVDWSGYPGYDPNKTVANIFAVGPVVSEALAASDSLYEEGIHANVISVVSPSILLGYHVGRKDKGKPSPHLGHLIPPNERSRAPVVTVADAAPSYLAGIGDHLGIAAGVKNLGVTDVGFSARYPETLLIHHGISREAIAGQVRLMLHQRDVDAALGARTTKKDWDEEEVAVRDEASPSGVQLMAAADIPESGLLLSVIKNVNPLAGEELTQTEVTFTFRYHANYDVFPSVGRVRISITRTEEEDVMDTLAALRDFILLPENIAAYFDIFRIKNFDIPTTDDIRQGLTVLLSSMNAKTSKKVKTVKTLNPKGRVYTAKVGSGKKKRMLATRDERLLGVLPYIEKDQPIPVRLGALSPRESSAIKAAGRTRLGGIYSADGKYDFGNVAITPGKEYAQETLYLRVRRVGEKSYDLEALVDSQITAHRYVIASVPFSRGGEVLSSRRDRTLPFSNTAITKEIMSGLMFDDLPEDLQVLSKKDLLARGVSGLFEKRYIHLWWTVQLKIPSDFKDPILKFHPHPKLKKTWIATLWEGTDRERPEIPHHSITVSKKGVLEKELTPATFITGYSHVKGPVPRTRKWPGDIEDKRVRKTRWDIHWFANGGPSVPPVDVWKRQPGRHSDRVYQIEKKMVELPLDPRLKSLSTKRFRVGFPSIAPDARGYLYHDTKTGVKQAYVMYANKRFYKKKPVDPSLASPSAYGTGARVLKADILSALRKLDERLSTDASLSEEREIHVGTLASAGLKAIPYIKDEFERLNAAEDTAKQTVKAALADAVFRIAILHGSDALAGLFGPLSRALMVWDINQPQAIKDITNFILSLQHIGGFLSRSQRYALIDPLMGLLRKAAVPERKALRLQKEIITILREFSKGAPPNKKRKMMREFISYLDNLYVLPGSLFWLESQFLLIEAIINLINRDGNLIRDEVIDFTLGLRKSEATDIRTVLLHICASALTRIAEREMNAGRADDALRKRLRSVAAFLRSNLPGDVKDDYAELARASITGYLASLVSMDDKLDEKNLNAIVKSIHLMPSIDRFKIDEMRFDQITRLRSGIAGHLVFFGEAGLEAALKLMNRSDAKSNLYADHILMGANFIQHYALKTAFNGAVEQTRLRRTLRALEKATGHLTGDLTEVGLMAQKALADALFYVLNHLPFEERHQYFNLITLMLYKLEGDSGVRRDVVKNIKAALQIMGSSIQPQLEKELNRTDLKGFAYRVLAQVLTSSASYQPEDRMEITTPSLRSLYSNSKELFLEFVTQYGRYADPRIPLDAMARVYNHPRFSRLVSRVSKTEQLRWSIALATAQNLARLDHEFSNAKIEFMLKTVIEELRHHYPRAVATPEVPTLIIATHSEKRFDADRLRNFYRRTGAGHESTYVYDGGENAYQWKGTERKPRTIVPSSAGLYSVIGSSKGKTLFVFEGHGLKKELVLSSSLMNGGIAFLGVKPFSSALLERLKKTGEALSEITMIIDSCFSYDFAENVYVSLHALIVTENRSRQALDQSLLPTRMPYIFTLGHKDSQTWSDENTVVYEKWSKRDTLTWRDLFRAQNSALSKQDPAMFIPLSKDKFQAIQASLSQLPLEANAPKAGSFEPFGSDIPLLLAGSRRTGPITLDRVDYFYPGLADENVQTIGINRISYFDVIFDEPVKPQDIRVVIRYRKADAKDSWQERAAIPINDNGIKQRFKVFLPDEADSYTVHVFTGGTNDPQSVGGTVSIQPSNELKTLLHLVDPDSESALIGESLDLLVNELDQKALKDWDETDYLMRQKKDVLSNFRKIFSDVRFRSDRYPIEDRLRILRGADHLTRHVLDEVHILRKNLLDRLESYLQEENLKIIEKLFKESEVDPFIYLAMLNEGEEGLGRTRFNKTLEALFKVLDFVNIAMVLKGHASERKKLVRDTNERLKRAFTLYVTGKTGHKVFKRELDEALSEFKRQLLPYILDAGIRFDKDSVYLTDPRLKRLFEGLISLYFTAGRHVQLLDRTSLKRKLRAVFIKMTHLKPGEVSAWINKESEWNREIYEGIVHADPSLKKIFGEGFSTKLQAQGSGAESSLWQVDLRSDFFSDLRSGFEPCPACLSPTRGSAGDKLAVTSLDASSFFLKVTRDGRLTADGLIHFFEPSKDEVLVAYPLYSNLSKLDVYERKLAKLAAWKALYDFMEDRYEYLAVPSAEEMNYMQQPGLIRLDAGLETYNQKPKWSTIFKSNDIVLKPRYDIPISYEWKNHQLRTQLKLNLWVRRDGLKRAIGQLESNLREAGIDIREPDAAGARYSGSMKMRRLEISVHDMNIFKIRGAANHKQPPFVYQLVDDYRAFPLLAEMDQVPGELYLPFGSGKLNRIFKEKPDKISNLINNRDSNKLFVIYMRTRGHEYVSTGLHYRNKHFQDLEELQSYAKEWTREHYGALLNVPDTYQYYAPKLTWFRTVQASGGVMAVRNNNPMEDDLFTEFGDEVLLRANQPGYAGIVMRTQKRVATKSFEGPEGELIDPDYLESVQIWSNGSWESFEKFKARRESFYRSLSVPDDLDVRAWLLKFMEMANEKGRDYQMLLFDRGMMWRSNREWWGDMIIRSTLHEGDDIAKAINSKGEVSDIQAGDPVPSPGLGIVVGREEDFMGDALFIALKRRDDKGNLVSIYVDPSEKFELHAYIMHFDTDKNVGDELEFGDLLGVTSDPEAKKRPVPAHDHSGLLAVRKDYDYVTHGLDAINPSFQKGNVYRLGFFHRPEQANFQLGLADVAVWREPNWNTQRHFYDGNLHKPGYFGGLGIASRVSKAQKLNSSKKFINESPQFAAGPPKTPSGVRISSKYFKMVADVLGDLKKQWDALPDEYKMDENWALVNELASEAYVIAGNAATDLDEVDSGPLIFRLRSIWSHIQQLKLSVRNAEGLKKYETQLDHLTRGVLESAAAYLNPRWLGVERLFESLIANAHDGPNWAEEHWGILSNFTSGINFDSEVPSLTETGWQGLLALHWMAYIKSTFDSGKVRMIKELNLDPEESQRLIDQTADAIDQYLFWLHDSQEERALSVAGLLTNLQWAEEEADGIVSFTWTADERDDLLNNVWSDSVNRDLWHILETLETEVDEAIFAVAGEDIGDLDAEMQIIVFDSDDPRRHLLKARHFVRHLRQLTEEGSRVAAQKKMRSRMGQMKEYLSKHDDDLPLKVLLLMMWEKRRDWIMNGRDLLPVELKNGLTAILRIVPKTSDDGISLGLMLDGEIIPGTQIKNAKDALIELRQKEDEGEFKTGQLTAQGILILERLSDNRLRGELPLELLRVNEILSYTFPIKRFLEIDDIGTFKDQLKYFMIHMGRQVNRSGGKDSLLLPKEHVRKLKVSGRYSVYEEALEELKAQIKNFSPEHWVVPVAMPGQFIASFEGDEEGDEEVNLVSVSVGDLDENTLPDWIGAVRFLRTLAGFYGTYRDPLTGVIDRSNPEITSSQNKRFTQLITAFNTRSVEKVSPTEERHLAHRLFTGRAKFKKYRWRPLISALGVLQSLFGAFRTLGQAA